MLISKCCGCFTQDQILQTVGNCESHNSPFMYICLQKLPSCVADPLMCPTCIQAHKGHNFQSINNYFTAETKHTLRTGTSTNGKAVTRLYDHVLTDIQKMRGRLNNQIDKLQATAKIQIRRLKKLYPLDDQFGLPGTYLDKKNVGQLINIVSREKQHNWVPASQKYIRSIVGNVNTMLGNLLIDLQQHIAGVSWESLTMYQSQKMIDQFFKKYQGKYDPEHHYFTFSGQEKHDNVRISQQSLIAKFAQTIPSKPAVLTDNPFTRKHDRVFFKMLKVQKSLVIFDASVVIVGACVPQTAKVFGYRNLLEPTHGAYMIGSNGKSYHSNLQKYSKKSQSFKFTEKDVIMVQIDYENALIKFAKWGFFQRKFEMELDIKEEDLYKLRPVVLFHGQKGAMVKIVDQAQYKHRQEDEDII